MDVVERVYTLTEGITDIIADSSSPKSTTVLQIFNLVTQIQNLVAPLLMRRHISSYLLECLQDTHAVLAKTRRSLQVLHEGRSNKLRTMLGRRSGTKDLKEDREFLALKYTALLSAVQVVSHITGYNIITPTSSKRHQLENKSAQSLKMKMKTADTDQASLFEADHFWKSYIGDESVMADSEEFLEVLSLWMDEPLSDLACKRLLLRLDEARTGTISFSKFQEFVRQGNMREIVHLYASDPQLPLLIWVDHDVSALIPKVKEATEQNITIYQFASTSATKSWVTMNAEFLKVHMDSGQIRFFINQILYEYNDYHVRSTNDSAGLQITAFVREHGIKVPILIYTSKSNMHLTRFVEDFEMTGSLCGNYLVFQAYLAALAVGRKDDTRWMRYNA